MVTREINKRESPYAPELEPELISVVEDGSSRGRTVAKLSLLWVQRFFIFRCVVLGFILSTIVAFLIPPRYTSTSRLMPPDQSGAGIATMLAALTKGSGEMGTVGQNLLGVKTSGDLFIGVLRSQTVENAVIDKFDLRKVYGDRRWKDARDDLEDRTDASADRKSGIITIKVNDRSPRRAAEIGHEYVNQLNHVVTTLDTSSAHRERVFLETRLTEVQRDLETAEKDFGQFASQNATLDVKEQGKAMIGAGAELQGQLIAAQTALEGLRQSYTSGNVRVRSMQARVDEYRRQLRKMGGKAPPAADASIPRNDGSKGQGQEDYPSIRELPILGVAWTDLYRRTKVEEAVYETLIKQFEMAKVEEARETPSVKVLDEGDVPERKSFPPRSLLMFIGTNLMFAVSAVWVLASARWQNMDPHDPGKALVQEVFQTIQNRVGLIRHGSRVAASLRRMSGWIHPGGGEN